MVVMMVVVVVVVVMVMVVVVVVVVVVVLLASLVMLHSKLRLRRSPLPTLLLSNPSRAGRPTNRALRFP